MYTLLQEGIHRGRNVPHRYGRAWVMVTWAVPCHPCHWSLSSAFPSFLELSQGRKTPPGKVVKLIHVTFQAWGVGEKWKSQRVPALLSPPPPTICSLVESAYQTEPKKGWLCDSPRTKESSRSLGALQLPPANTPCQTEPLWAILTP